VLSSRWFVLLSSCLAWSWPRRERPRIDRGSYVDGRDFDLTAATRQRLRFSSTGTLLSSR
jgi:hypothetical protein